MAMERPQKAAPGSAEFLASQLSGPELSCPHFPKYRAEEDRRYPSRLGFFSSNSEPKVTYLETNKLCIVCLEAALPDGFNYIPPSTPATSSSLPTKKHSLSLQAFQAGLQDLNRDSQRRPTPRHLIAPPVTISLPQLPSDQHGWNWLKSQRKPFYADGLYPLDDRPPIVKVAALRNAEIATNAGTPYAGQPIAFNPSALRADLQHPVLSKEKPTLRKRQSELEGKNKTGKSTAKVKSQDHDPKPSSPHVPPVPASKLIMNGHNDLSLPLINPAGLTESLHHEVISRNRSLETAMTTTTTVRSKPLNGLADSRPNTKQKIVPEPPIKLAACDSRESSVIKSMKTTDEPQTSSSIINWQDLMMPMAGPVFTLNAKPSTQSPGIEKQRDVSGKSKSGDATATAQVMVSLTHEPGPLHQTQGTPVAAVVPTARSQTQQSTLPSRPRHLAKNWSRHDPIPFQDSSQIPPLKAYKRTAGIQGQDAKGLPLEKLLPKGTIIANDQDLSRFQFPDQSSGPLRQVLTSSPQGPDAPSNNPTSSRHFIDSLLSSATSMAQAHNGIVHTRGDTGLGGPRPPSQKLSRVQGASTTSKITRSVKKKNVPITDGHGPLKPKETPANKATTQSSVPTSEPVKGASTSTGSGAAAKESTSPKDQTRGVPKGQKEKVKQTPAPSAAPKPPKVKETPSSTSPSLPKKGNDAKNQESKLNNDQAKVSSTRSLESTSALSSSTAAAYANKTSVNHTQTKESLKVHKEASGAEAKTHGVNKDSDRKGTKAKGSGNTKTALESTLNKLKAGVSNAALGGSKSLHNLKSKLEGDKSKKSDKVDVKKEAKKEGKLSKPAKADRQADKPPKVTGDKSLKESKKKEKAVKSAASKASESRSITRKKDVKSKTTKTTTKKLQNKKSDSKSSEAQESSDDDKRSSVDNSDSDGSDSEDDPGSTNHDSDSGGSDNDTTSRNSSKSPSSEGEEDDEQSSGAKDPDDSDAAEDSDQENPTKPDNPEISEKEPADDAAQDGASTEDVPHDPDQPSTMEDVEKAEENATPDEAHATDESQTYNDPSAGGEQADANGPRDLDEPLVGDAGSTTKGPSVINKPSTAEEFSANTERSIHKDTHAGNQNINGPTRAGNSSSSAALAGAAIAGAAVADVVAYNIMNSSSTIINIVEQSSEETVLLTRSASTTSMASSTHGDPQGEASDVEGENSTSSTIHAGDDDHQEGSSSSSAGDSDREHVPDDDDSKSHRNSDEGHDRQHDGEATGWVSSDDDDNRDPETHEGGNGGNDSDSDNDNNGQHSVGGAEDIDNEQHSDNDPDSDEEADYRNQAGIDDYSVSGLEHGRNEHTEDSDDGDNHYEQGNSSGEEGNGQGDSDGEGGQDRENEGDMSGDEGGFKDSDSNDGGHGDSGNEGGSNGSRGDDNDSDYHRGSSVDGDNDDQHSHNGDEGGNGEGHSQSGNEQNDDSDDGQNHAVDSDGDRDEDGGDDDWQSQGNGDGDDDDNDGQSDSGQSYDSNDGHSGGGDSGEDGNRSGGDDGGYGYGSGNEDQSNGGDDVDQNEDDGQDEDNDQDDDDQDDDDQDDDDQDDDDQDDDDQDDDDQDDDDQDDDDEDDDDQDDDDEDDDDQDDDDQYDNDEDGDDQDDDEDGDDQDDDEDGDDQDDDDQVDDD